MTLTERLAALLVVALIACSFAVSVSRASVAEPVECGPLVPVRVCEFVPSDCWWTGDLVLWLRCP